MTHKKAIHKKNYTGRIVAAGIVIIGGIAYGVFASFSTGETSAGVACSLNASKQGTSCAAKTNTPTTTPVSTISTPVSTTATLATASSYETINVGHDATSLIPSTLNLVAGKSYKLIITPSANGAGCMNTMTIPGLDSNVYPVKNGVPVTITINNAKAGNYEVICGAMGMHQGNIVIQ